MVKSVDLKTDKTKTCVQESKELGPRAQNLIHIRVICKSKVDEPMGLVLNHEFVSICTKSPKFSST